MTAPLPFTEITDLLERAARNGTKAHLGPDLARALIESEAYRIITAERTKELVATWHDNRKAAAPRPASSLETSGLSPEPSEANGPSHGTMQALVHAAEEQQASLTAAKLSRRSRRKRH